MRRFLGIIALLTAGCAAWDTGAVAHERAAEALSCERDSVTMRQVGAYRYVGEGCGGEVTLACTAAALEPVCMEEGATSGDEEEVPAEDAPSREELEANIRSRLEALAEDLLGCVGEDRVGVRLAYGAEGEITISLQGRWRGSPEEGCVASLFRGLRVPSRGLEGEVIHLVRAPPRRSAPVERAAPAPTETPDMSRLRTPLSGEALSDDEVRFIHRSLEASSTPYTERGLDTFVEWQLGARVTRTERGFRLFIAGERVSAEWEVLIDRDSGEVTMGTVAEDAPPPRLPED